MPRGNRDFGNKYRFNYGREKPLTEQVKAQVDEETKERLRMLAAQKECTVPDLIRAAIDEYLASSTLLDEAS